MERVRFCKHCRHLLKEGFLYCPYCGQEWKDDSTMEEIVDKGFEPLEHREINSTLNTLEQLSNKLDIIDSELELFLSHSV
ncbi:hypothetical protein [Spirochaeta cellobiosiphila]|uniref:hypothetical protein n=1 Tax=Spirochaeta cellobiosiphila TaxID=504483 RepID=UPI0012EB7609|nr:hypothetical protein [Spirochaeta cellobiosiphila]